MAQAATVLQDGQDVGVLGHQLIDDILTHDKRRLLAIKCGLALLVQIVLHLKS